MPEFGHLKRLLPIIEALATGGAQPHVFTDRRYAGAVLEKRGLFHDLFEGRSLDGLGDDSRPVPCRYVTFAAHHADALAQETARLRAAVVVHDAFAVVAVAVANRLSLPRVNFCAGHNLAPGPTLETLRVDPRVRVAEPCHRAVEVLRQRFAMDDASPFSYITSLSRELNLVCEPPEFLTAEEAAAFAPTAFFGSLPTGLPREPASAPQAGRLRIYASLGTVVWRYYAPYAREVLASLAQACQERGDCELVIGLGGQPLDDGFRRLVSRHTCVEPYVDQWAQLAASDLFLTHQGLNSTHEAIAHQVPMLSSPFFADQPGLASRCREFGLALPVVDDLRGPVDARAMHSALERARADRDTMGANLRRARHWELAVIAERPAVVSRILDLP